MEKTNIRRLIGVMMPYMILVILQRLGLLVLEKTPLSPTLCSLLAFAAASAVGIVFFRMSCGAESIRLQTLPETHADGKDSDRHVPPFPACDTVPGQGMCVLVCIGALVVAMHAVTALVGVQSADLPDMAMPAAEFVSLVLIHPLLEEYVFRWLYYRELRPMHPIFAGLAQAVMFAIVHGSVSGMIYALFAGVILAVALEQSGSLAVTILSHALVNLRSFVYLAWLADGVRPNAAHIRTVIDFCIVSIGFGAFLALMVRRGLRDVWDRAETEDSADDEE